MLKATQYAIWATIVPDISWVL